MDRYFFSSEYFFPRRLLLPAAPCCKKFCDIHSTPLPHLFRGQLTDQSMDEHRTAQDVEVHQGGDVGNSGVENGRDRDSMLATDDAESDKENTVPP
jgi:hypothetical protein